MTRSSRSQESTTTSPCWHMTMNSMRPYLPALGIVFAGAVTVCALCMPMLRHGAGTSHPTLPATTPWDTSVTPQTAAASVRPDDPMITVLSRRIQALESRQPRADDSSSPPQRRQRSEAEIDEARATFHQTHWVDRFNTEGRDAAWAEKTERSVHDEIARTLGSVGAARLLDVACHSTMCAANVEWSSFASVADDARKLAEHAIREHCVKELAYPQPDDTTAPYQATLYLDCEGDRIGT
jgi:hypothetical protein